VVFLVFGSRFPVLGWCGLWVWVCGVSGFRFSVFGSRLVWVLGLGVWCFWFSVLGLGLDVMEVMPPAGRVFNWQLYSQGLIQKSPIVNRTHSGTRVTIQTESFTMIVNILKIYPGTNFLLYS
jgi:hypothetical protein